MLSLSALHGDSCLLVIGGNDEFLEVNAVLDGTLVSDFHGLSNFFYR